MNVSMETVPSASACPPSEVRWMSAVASDGICDVHRPVTYHFVVVPAVVTPRSSTCIHVPCGVSAVQLVTICVAPKPRPCHGDVHVAVSNDVGVVVESNGSS